MKDPERTTRRLLAVFLATLAVALLARPAPADDYQCAASAGCHAIRSTPDGTERVRFRRGDVVSTAHGWVVDPGDGWDPVDLTFLPQPGEVEPNDRLLLATPSPAETWGSLSWPGDVDSFAFLPRAPTVDIAVMTAPATASLSGGGVEHGAGFRPLVLAWTPRGELLGAWALGAPNVLVLGVPAGRGLLVQVARQPGPQAGRLPYLLRVAAP